MEACDGGKQKSKLTQITCNFANPQNFNDLLHKVPFATGN